MTNWYLSKGYRNGIVWVEFEFYKYIYKLHRKGVTGIIWTEDWKTMYKPSPIFEINLLNKGLNDWVKFKEQWKIICDFWSNLGEITGYKQIEENSCFEELNFIYRTSKGVDDKQNQE